MNQSLTIILLLMRWEIIVPILLGTIIVFLVFASGYICSNIYLHVLCKGQKKSNEICITFDDGPHEIITPEILTILDKYNVKATFFCIGEKLKKNKNLVNLIDKKGHIIGNHSWSHSWFFNFKSSTKLIGEITKTDLEIHNIINKTPLLFRPPYGVTNPPLAKALKQTDHTAIGWTIRSMDTVKSERKVFNRLKRKLKPGSIILFHDNQQTTLSLLGKFIEYSEKKGMKFVNLDELLQLKPYKENNETNISRIDE